MKKLLTALFAIGCATAFAGIGDLLISFSTPGPDKYADGSTVLDGECYALVWTAADGTQETVLTAPFAKDGKCPLVIFEIDENDVANYKDGAWGVYLLDTRDFANDEAGKTLAGVNDDGSAKLVNAQAAVGDAFTAAGVTSAKSGEAVGAGAYDLSGIENPVITGIEVVGAKIVVTVANTAPFVGYTLATVGGDNLADFTVPEGAAVANGKTGGEIKLVLDKQGDTRLFKVVTVK